MDILFMPYNKNYKAPLGALLVNEEVKFNIHITKRYVIYNLSIVISNDDGFVMKQELNLINDDFEYNIYQVALSFDVPNLYFYHFEFYDCYGLHYIGRSDSLDASLVDYYPNNFELTVKSQKLTSEFNWYKGKIMYQILVDRFNKGGNNPVKKGAYIHKNWDDELIINPINNQYNVDFYGGDLLGVIEKVNYLYKLGVRVIYFNPIFSAPSSHKYNTSNYLELDTMYGTLDDFKTLIKITKKLNMYVILDGVFNHTGDDSIYFNKYQNYDTLGAYNSKDSVYYDWYRFIEYPYKYHSWWGIDSLPSINFNSSFVDFICDEVIPYWMSFGIKGFRLDVVDELPDFFVQKINKAIKNIDKDAIVIGEVWEDATNKISYDIRRTYFIKQELDSVMNYVIKNAIIDYLKNHKLNKLVYCLREQINNYHFTHLHLLMNILSTHDTPRILSTFSKVTEFALSKFEKINYKMEHTDYLNARSKVKLAYTILYTIPGIPCIYYGDEVGMEGYRDPYCRKVFPKDKIDSNLLEFIELLGQIRSEHEVYVDGEYNEILFNEEVFIFSRTKNNLSLITIINNSHYEFNYHINGFDLFDNINITTNVIVYPKTSKIIKKYLA